jgi:hypothetical protein
MGNRQLSKISRLLHCKSPPVPEQAVMETQGGDVNNTAVAISLVIKTGLRRKRKFRRFGTEIPPI